MARIALCAALLVSLPAAPAAAQSPPVRRYAVVVGANRGADQDQVLRYAEADAVRMSAVLGYLGGFPRGSITELYSPNASELNAAVDALADKARAARARGEQALIVFYYSGHSDGDALRTRGELVPFVRLRRVLKASGAAMRLLVVDACRAGGLTRRKGATTHSPLDVRALDELASEGEAFIASTTSDELARESSTLRGSFFTHHLVSGLRGAADRSGDGRVTLSEAYNYAYARTVLEAGGEQHPTYNFDLSGHGDLVLTSLREASAAIQLAAAPRHEVLILDAGSNVVAEVRVTPGTGVRVALPAGTYVLRIGGTNDARSVQVTLANGQVLDVDPAQAAPIATIPTVRKGPAAPLQPARASRAALLFGIGLGVGTAWYPLGTRSEVAWERASSDGWYRPVTVEQAGISSGPPPFHLRLELGGRFIGKWDLVASLRVQLNVGANAESQPGASGITVEGTRRATGAMAGLLRARRRFPRGPIAPFVEVVVGGGELRTPLALSVFDVQPPVDEHTARAFNAGSSAVQLQTVCANPTRCVDSVALGYALVGGGAGLQMELFSRDKGSLALSMSTTFLGAFAGRQTGLMVDWELGLLARLL